jgi:hypothetical protein
MAKPKAQGVTAATGRKPRRDKATEAEAELHAYHVLGLKVISRVKDGRLDAQTAQELIAETGYGADTIRKTCVLAVRYSARQLDELCQLRTPAGMPLCWRHVRQLLMLPAGEARDAFQRKVAERGWDLEELIAAVPEKVRRTRLRRDGGRAFRRPKTRSAALEQIQRYGEAWLQRYRKAWEGFDWHESKPGMAGPGGLGARIAEARQTLKKLNQTAKRLDAQLNKLELEQAGP